MSSIVVTNLKKSYGDVTAVQGLTFDVPYGAIYGFIGANGAGKTTTIDCLSGLSDPDEGEVQLLGVPFRDGDLNIKKRIGILPSNLALFDYLTAYEFLVFQAQMFKINRGDAQRRSEDLLAALDLMDDSQLKLIHFSTGMRKKVAFAAAVIHSPEILFLDEPFESVDPASVATMKMWLKNFANSGRTVFFSSHVLDVIENFCTKVAILEKGRLAWEGEMKLPYICGGHEFYDLESLFLHIAPSRGVEISWL